MARSGIRGEQVRDDSLTGDDIDESSLILPHFTTHKYTLTSSSDMILIRFNAAGSNTMGSSQVNNKFVAPASGALVMVKFRTTGTPGSTEIALMKISDGTLNFGSPGTPQVSTTIDVSSANTTYTASFSTNNTFNGGDVLGVRIDPTNNHGNVDITCVWDLNFSP
tara:strand:+ start:501 stop:995 length:495 start_codon:yes stop_codon:yes gene_type:complete